VILVDACVLIDLVSGDPHWADWSAAQLDSWSKRGPLIINGMVYAELASGFDSIEMLESFVATAHGTWTRLEFWLNCRQPLGPYERLHFSFADFRFRCHWFRCVGRDFNRRNSVG
jgi:hypothetical protein